MNIIILVSLIVLTIALLIYTKLKSRNDKLKILSLFEKFAAKHGGTISQYEIWDEFIIGIDRETRKIFFTTLGNETGSVIDLLKVKQCNVNISRMENNQNVKSITLTFLLKQEGGKPLIIEFFNTDYKLILGNEIQLAEKWHKIIVSELNRV